MTDVIYLLENNNLHNANIYIKTLINEQKTIDKSGDYYNKLANIFFMNKEARKFIIKYVNIRPTDLPRLCLLNIDQNINQNIEDNIFNVQMINDAFNEYGYTIRCFLGDCNFNKNSISSPFKLGELHLIIDELEKQQLDNNDNINDYFGNMLIIMNQMAENISGDTSFVGLNYAAEILITKLIKKYIIKFNNDFANFNKEIIQSWCKLNTELLKNKKSFRLVDNIEYIISDYLALILVYNNVSTNTNINIDNDILHLLDEHKIINIDEFNKYKYNYENMDIDELKKYLHINT